MKLRFARITPAPDKNYKYLSSRHITPEQALQPPSPTMKTDRFTDSIRRKLESIRPEFTEKDWSKMQKSLHQANLSQPGSSPAGHPFSGGMWTAKSWLLAAASVSTVVLIAFSMWQRREITQLRQTLGQQNPQSTRSAIPERSDRSVPTPVDSPALTHARIRQNQPNGALPAASDNKTASQPRPDTVYIDRYVAVPSPVRSVPPEAERPAQQSDRPAEKSICKNKPRTDSGKPIRQIRYLNPQPVNRHIWCILYSAHS